MSLTFWHLIFENFASPCLEMTPLRCPEMDCALLIPLQPCCSSYILFIEKNQTNNMNQATFPSPALWQSNTSAANCSLHATTPRRLSSRNIPKQSKTSTTSCTPSPRAQNLTIKRSRNQPTRQKSSSRSTRASSVPRAAEARRSRMVSRDESARFLLGRLSSSRKPRNRPVGPGM